MTGIFINYRTEDHGFAANLIDERLRKEFGDKNVFLDSRSLQPGIQFPPKLWNRLMACTVLLVVIGPHWLRFIDKEQRIRLIDNPNDYVRREIGAALQRENMRVIPVLLDKAKLPSAAELPKEIAQLSERQFIQLRGRNSHIDLDHLVNELVQMVPRTHLPAPQGGSTQTPKSSNRTSNVTLIGSEITTGDITGGDHWTVTRTD